MFQSNKRPRNEDEEELAELRNESKKPRALPFRTSPTTKHTFLFSQSFRTSPKPATLTPAESSADEDEYPFHRVPSSRRKSFTPPPIIPTNTTTTTTTYPDSDSDLDMLDSPDPLPSWTRAPSSPPQSRLHLPKNNNTLANGTRIPTPIYGHFNHPQDSHLTLPSTTTSQSTTTTTTTTFSKAQDLSNVHSLFLTRRRLPSPISEDEAMDSPLTMTGSMLHRLDMNAAYNYNNNNSANNNASLLQKASSPVTPTYDSQMQDIAIANGNGNQTLEMRTKGKNIRDERRGAVGGWGGQGREKAVLSMGFRADCDKCRGRVPGHWSHVLRG